MKVILGADHGGYYKKETIKNWLFSNGYDVLDVGSNSLVEDDDFVDYAKVAVSKYLDGDKMILFCRNGFGMSIVANRYTGIRCGFGFNIEAVARGRNDDDINALAIPADYLEEDEMVKIVEVFLKEKFSDDVKYQRRVKKIDNIRLW